MKKLFSNETAEEKQRAAKAGRKGGLKRAEKEKERKTMAQDFGTIANLILSKNRKGMLEDVTYFTDAAGANLTAQQKACLAIAIKAMNGDVAALTLWRDTMGQKPIEKIVTSEIPAEEIEEVESIVQEVRKKKMGDSK